MLLLIFAVIVSGDPRGATQPEPGRVSLNLDYAGVLPLPPSLSHRYTYPNPVGGRLAIRGYSEDGETFVLFVFDTGTDGVTAFRRELAALGLEPNALTRVAQNRGQLNPEVEIMRTDGEGLYPDHLIAIADRGTGRFAALFILIGPRESFYRYTPDFTAMVEGYRPDAEALLSLEGRVSVTNIVVAILLLLTNIFFIWLGFREIARSGGSEE